MGSQEPPVAMATPPCMMYLVTLVLLGSTLTPASCQEDYEWELDEEGAIPCEKQKCPPLIPNEKNNTAIRFECVARREIPDLFQDIYDEYADEVQVTLSEEFKNSTICAKVEVDIC